MKISDRLTLFFRLLSSDKTMNTTSLNVHMNNLYRVVQYCENITECRRLQLLEYFGETGFDPRECRDNHVTMCDNCSQVNKITQLDVTRDTKLIVESVNQLIHRENSNWARPMSQLTLNQLVDVFKVRYMLINTAVAKKMPVSLFVCVCMQRKWCNILNFCKNGKSQGLFFSMIIIHNLPCFCAFNSFSIYWW